MTNTTIPTETGEIPSDPTKNPQVEVEVPTGQVGDVTEYSYGYWFRFQYRIPETLDINVARNSFLAMAGVSENNDWTITQNCGDRALATYYIPHNKATKPTYRFSTYSNNGECKQNAYKDISLPWESFEGAWYYIYFGYSYGDNQANAFIRGDNGQVHQVQLTGKKHNWPLTGLYFSFGTDKEYNVNGLYADLRFSYQAGAYVKDSGAFGQYFTKEVQPHPNIVSVDLDLKTIHSRTYKMHENGLPKWEIWDHAQSTDYSAYGWLRWNPNTN